MADVGAQEKQFDWVIKVTKVVVVASLVVIVLGAIGGVAMTVAAIGEAVDTGQWTNVVPYVLSVLAALLAVGWLSVTYGLVQALVANESAVSNAAVSLSRIETFLDDQTHSLNRLINLASLSDKAKSLIYRDRELEAMREVIHEDTMRQDYDTAAALIDMMETKFGYADEAARLREELDQSRKATFEEKIDNAVARVQRIIEEHDFARATRAAERLIGMFPDHPKITSLPERVETEHANHKKKLLEEYRDAVNRNDVNRGVELLKELDRHLTPQEAAALQESARGVFKAKLHNLGVQFAIQVTDQRWAEAVATGEEIIKGFPNSRMSHEVRQKMPQLRELMSASAETSAAGSS